MASVMMLVAAVVSLLPPKLLKLIVDEIVENKDYRELALVGAGLVLWAAIEILSTFIQARSMGKWDSISYPASERIFLKDYSSCLLIILIIVRMEKSLYV